MEIMDIISDSVTYPFENIKSLLIYLVLGLILGIVSATTLAGSILSAKSSSFVALIIAVIGVIISVLISFLINGYGLDIIKLGLTRSSSSPQIDFERQITNGVKLLVVSIVYMIVPTIIFLILSLIFNNWILYLVGFILFVLFYLALAMAQCRLAKTEDLSYALDIKSSINDIFNIGVIKVVLTIIAIILIGTVIIIILSIIFSAIFGQTIASSILGIVGVYLSFFTFRAMGLLYSEI